MSVSVGYDAETLTSTHGL